MVGLLAQLPLLLLFLLLLRTYCYIYEANWFPLAVQPQQGAA
jgi:hypothetical protein